MNQVAEYQEALREKSVAEKELSTLAARLESTAKLLARGNPESFMLAPQSARPPTGNANENYLLRTTPLRESEWPSSATVSMIASRVAAARLRVKTTWDAIAPENRIGLTPP